VFQTNNFRNLPQRTQRSQRKSKSSKDAVTTSSIELMGGWLMVLTFGLFRSILSPARIRPMARQGVESIWIFYSEVAPASTKK
jgi:hypothetical protein